MAFISSSLTKTCTIYEKTARYLFSLHYCSIYGEPTVVEYALIHHLDCVPSVKKHMDCAIFLSRLSQQK